MPIRKGTATFSRYRVAPAGKRGAHADQDLSKALRTHAFQPLEKDSPEERTQGFVEVEDSDQVEFSKGALYQGEIALFSYRVDEVRLPSAIVKAELETWAKAFEAENGRKPGKKEKTDAKGEIRHTLRSRYPLSSKTFDVSWNQETELLQIWAGSRKAVDEVQGAVERAFSVKLTPVVPIAVGARLQLAVDQLKPTPQLSMEETHGKS